MHKRFMLDIAYLSVANTSFGFKNTVIISHYHWFWQLGVVFPVRFRCTTARMWFGWSPWYWWSCYNQLCQWSEWKKRSFGFPKSSGVSQKWLQEKNPSASPDREKHLPPHQGEMFLILAVYTCIHDSDEFPVVLPEKFDSSWKLLNWFNILLWYVACQTWVCIYLFPPLSRTYPDISCS